MTLWHCAEFHYTAPYICLQCVSHYLWGGQFNNFAFWFVPSCSQLSSILLPSWFSVYLFRSLSEYQCVSKSMDPLKYFLKICAFGIWQNALFLPFGLTYFNLVMTQIFYKASKHRFDNDQEFKERAQQGVVRLQVSGYLGCQLVKSGKVFSSEQCIYL